MRTLSFVSIFPSILVLFYTSWNLRHTDMTVRPSPLIRLVLPTLFTTSCGLWLFDEGAATSDLAWIMIPLLLMGCLRGGKEGGKAENEAWEMSILLNNATVLL
jgi:hypothetical protein